MVGTKGLPSTGLGLPAMTAAIAALGFFFKGAFGPNATLFAVGDPGPGGAGVGERGGHPDLEQEVKPHTTETVGPAGRHTSIPGLHPPELNRRPGILSSLMGS